MEKTMSFRRVITVALCATALVPAVAAAQTSTYPMTFGVKAGVNASTLAVEDNLLDTSSIWGAVGGLFVGRNITDNAGLQLEALFSQRGAKDVSSSSETRLRLTYLDLPLTARFGSTMSNDVHFHAFTGPQLGIKLSAKAKNDFLGVDEDLDDEVKSWDFGWTLGAGVEMNNLSLDARYTLGLTNIDASSSDGSIKNRTFTVLAGYRFR
jgi:opacity protein-like surface antigen